MNQEPRKQIRQTCAEFGQAVAELTKLEVTIQHCLKRNKDQKSLHTLMRRHYINLKAERLTGVPKGPDQLVVFSRE